MSAWKSFGATVIGPCHVASGKPNQDAWLGRQYCWGNVVAVSDGLGSCQHAEVGSAAACRAVAEAAKLCHLNAPVSPSDLLVLLQALWQTAVYPLAPRDCSATCLFVIREQEGRARMGMLGDGLVAGCRKNGKIDLLTEDKGDSFTNMTVGLASKDVQKKWRLLDRSEDEYDAFVLCTDGISEDLLREAVDSFVTEFCEHYREEPQQRITQDLRRWLTTWPVPGHTDDKTIACLYKTGKL